uniref:Uncharacterized protein n=1 Tax=Culex tarsalis TaxID=7177 RepID=A0A1Q3FTB3_CULTA
MAPNRIFLVELLVEDLQMFSRPQLAENPEKPSDKPAASDKRASLDKPAASDKPASTDKANSSDKQASLVKQASSEKRTSALEKPPSSDKPESQAKPASSEKPNSSEKPSEHPTPNSTANPPCETCPERCIRLQLNHLARCEVCEKDFGSQLDMERSKMGENCMFTLSDADLAEGPLTFRISAVERQPKSPSKVLGTWEVPATEMFQELAKNYDDANAKEQKSETSIMSTDSCSRKYKPVSETIKSMYPLHMEQDVVTGYVILTLRISCLGPRITQKVMFGAKESQTAITCFKSVVQDDQEERFMKCVAYDAVNHPHPVICGPCEDKLPPNPPASVSSQEKIPCSPYDEYTAELNGNAICVRVEKNSDIKVMLDGEQKGGCTQGCWTSLTLPEGVYALEERYVQRQENACRLPVIRGNLKYPAEQWQSDFMMCKRKQPIRAEDLRKRPDPTRSVCMQTRDPELPVSKTPCGIEICRKGYHDPNVDVFVLKLGKNKTSREADATNQIELELRTPKGPMVEKRPKETRGVQVIEAEFEELKKPAPPAEEKGKKGKKGGKKGDKKRDKKGDKKDKKK